MAQSNLMNKIWSPMMMSCFKLGGLVGGTIVVTLIFVDNPLNDGIFVLIAMCSPVLFAGGVFVGSSFGGIIGYLSGLAMWWITKQQQLTQSEFTYRVSVGLATAWIASLTLMPLFYKAPDFPYGMTRNNYLIALACSIGIAVYASQRIVTKYLRENNVVNQK